MQLGTPSKGRGVWTCKFAAVYPEVVCTVLTSCTREKTRTSHLNCPELAPDRKGWWHPHCTVFGLWALEVPYSHETFLSFCFKATVTTGMVCLQPDTESTHMTACGNISVPNWTVSSYLACCQRTITGGRVKLVWDISTLSGQSS